MFDYVKNRYNQNPNMVKISNKTADNLYVKFLNAPYLILPNTIDDFIFTHKSKFWYNLNRFEKIYRRDIGELKFEIIKDKHKLDLFLDKVFILFNEKWKDEYLSTSWKCKDGFDKYKQAMLNLSDTNEGFLAVLHGENQELLSYAYCLENNTTVYFYQYTTNSNSKYRKYSLGKVLVHNLLKYIIEQQKYKIFDFMNGEQGYKLEWTKQSEEVFIKIEGKTLNSYMKYFLFRIKIYLQFNDLFRNQLKMLLKLKEDTFGK